MAVLRPHAPYLRGAPPGLPFDWSEATVARGLNFTLTTAIGDIDLLGEGGGDYEALAPHTVVDIFGYGASERMRWPSWKRCSKSKEHDVTSDERTGTTPRITGRLGSSAYGAIAVA